MGVGIIQDLDGTISATVGAVQTAIAASTPEAALEVANSLTTVEF